MTLPLPEAPHQSDVDPVALVLAYLKAHPAVVQLFGSGEHVSGIEQAPWPHLVVSEGIASDLRRGDWEAQYEVAFHLLGHPNGAPGKAEVRRMAAKVLRAALELADGPEPDPTDPVVSDVRPSGGYVWHPLASGQPSYHFAIRFVVRPPQQLPPPAP